MKKAVICFLALLLLTSICHAEVYKNTKLGIQFTVPPGFKRGAGENWTGPKHGMRSWSIFFNGVSLAGYKEGNIRKMYELDLKNQKEMKDSYSYVQPVKVNGAVGAYLLKQVVKPNQFSYYWKVVIYSKHTSADLTFFGDPKTFKQYEPVINKVVRSIKIAK